MKDPLAQIAPELQESEETLKARGVRPPPSREEIGRHVYGAIQDEIERIMPMLASAIDPLHGSDEDKAVASKLVELRDLVDAHVTGDFPPEVSIEW